MCTRHNKKYTIIAAIFLWFACISSLAEARSPLVDNQRLRGVGNKRNLAEKATKATSTNAPSASTPAPTMSTSPSSSPTVVATAEATPAPPRLTSPPTSAPSESCMDDILGDDILEILATVSNPCHILTEGNPQYRAYQFILADDIIHTYSSSQELIQRYALVVVFFATYPHGSKYAENWISHATKECDWNPVTCSVDGIVTELSLSDHYLVGTIPDEMAALSSLTLLQLSSNALSGTIPSFFGSALTVLEELYLTGNALTGTVPVALSALSDHLQRLSFAVNQLSGSIPTELASLTTLQSLDGNYNQLTGTLPTEFAGLTDLDTLGFSGNALTGTLPLEWGHGSSLSKLRNLQLSANNLSGPIPDEWGSLSSLYILYLYQNAALVGPFPEDVCNISSLGFISTDWCYSKAHCCSS